MQTSGLEYLEHFEDRVLYHLVDLTGDKPARRGEGIDAVELAIRLAQDLEITPEFPKTAQFIGSTAHNQLWGAVESLRDEGLIDAVIYESGYFFARSTRSGRDRVTEWRKQWQQHRLAHERKIERRILEELNDKRRADPDGHKFKAVFDVAQICSEFEITRTECHAIAKRLMDQGKIAKNSIDQASLAEGYAYITEAGIRMLEASASGERPRRDAEEAWNRVALLERRLKIAERSLPSLIKDDDLRRRCTDLLTAEGDYDRVIREACVILEDRVRKAIGADKGLVGTGLMEKAFGLNSGVLRLSNNDQEQRGAMELYRSIMALFRNNAGHNVVESYSQDDALRFVVWADLLLEMVEHARLEMLAKLQPTGTTTS